MNKVFILSAALLVGASGAALAQGQDRQGGGRQNEQAPATKETQTPPVQKPAEQKEPKSQGTTKAQGETTRDSGKPQAQTQQPAQDAPKTPQTGQRETQQQPSAQTPRQTGEQPRSQTTTDTRKQPETTTPTQTKDSAQTKDQTKTDTTQRNESRTNVKINVTPEQKTRVREVVTRESSIKRVRRSDINFTINVGTRVPETVVYYDAPPTLVSVVPDVQRYKIIVLDDVILVVDPGTREIVDVIEI